MHEIFNKYNFKITKEDLNQLFAVVDDNKDSKYRLLIIKRETKLERIQEIRAK
jgi:hypothetical protein